MVEGRRLVEQSEGYEYLHKTVWRVVQRQIEYAETNPQGALYDDLVAMVFAFHAMEGYLNYVGGKIASDLWRDEKTQFSENGVISKLAAICERCGLGSPDYGKRPYGTLSELKKLRNAMAHPRTRKTARMVEYDERKPPPLFPQSYLGAIVSHPRALRARDDVKQIADQLHAAALTKFPEAGLGPDALDGIMSMRTTATRLSEPG
jgi:hypothetical protein